MWFKIALLNNLCIWVQSTFCALGQCCRIKYSWTWLCFMNVCLDNAKVLGFEWEPIFSQYERCIWPVSIISPSEINNAFISDEVVIETGQIRRLYCKDINFHIHTISAFVAVNIVNVLNLMFGHSFTTGLHEQISHYKARYSWINIYKITRLNTLSSASEYLNTAASRSINLVSKICTSERGCTL